MASTSTSRGLSKSDAVRAASEILTSAGLSGSELLASLGFLGSPREAFSESSFCNESPSQPSRTALTSVKLPQNPPSAAVLGYLYRAPQARRLTAAEIANGSNKITARSFIGLLVDHPLDAIVEYPQTGPGDNAVAHRFAVDASRFVDPKHNIQYSLGDSKGGFNDATCSLLRGNTGNLVLCKYSKISCKGLKICSENPQLHRKAAAAASITRFSPPRSPTKTSGQLVFEKTLSFFCALMEHGCSFDSPKDFDDNLAGSTQDCDVFDNEEPESTSRKRKADRSVCGGKLIMQADEYGQSLIQCEFRTPDSRLHLVLRNLDGFHSSYLSALLKEDSIAINNIEEYAKIHGYGPRVPCHYSAPPSAQKDLCPHWHRAADGTLKRGKLERHPGSCPVSFMFYVPNSLRECPFTVLVCRGVHSHPDPSPTKTPPALVSELKTMLLSLDWRLADATPRKIALDAGFISSLRQSLGWFHAYDPQISDLHPSLGNVDHLRRYIQELRIEMFPEGTGFLGAQHLVEKHLRLPEDERYVRCAESHTLADGKEFCIVVCMDRTMSFRLLEAYYMTIDTSFKRVKSWQEFEIQSWDDDHMKSVVSARALINSQSAEAHEILFERIFHFAELDTNRRVQFLHIHGEGYRCWVADAHKGQALGLGRFCCKISAHVHVPCSRDSSRLVSSLNPYDHLSRFYKVCTVHFKRHVHDLRGVVSHEVRGAMLSLASSEYHPNFEGALSTISNGGKKAKAWLKDKQDGKFVIPALYQPKSLIPLDIWKAAPSDTNGNEQSHRDINRDGVMLTLIGGIHRGMAYDRRVSASIVLYDRQGIYSHDQQYTSFRRAMKSVTRAGNVQRKLALSSSLSNIERSKTSVHTVQGSSNQFKDPPITLPDSRLQTSDHIYTSFPLRQYQENISLMSHYPAPAHFPSELAQQPSQYTEVDMGFPRLPCPQYQQRPTAFTSLPPAEDYLNSVGPAELHYDIFNTGTGYW